ncbi:MAG: LysE family translocator [Pseudomonadota bacterium]
MSVDNNLLPPWPLLSTFMMASFILAVTPGPGVFYIVTRSVLQGRSFGFASVAGVALGNMGNAIGASLGLAALFAVSSFAFTGVKAAGALYIIFLGIQALRAPVVKVTAEPSKTHSLWRIFRDGLFVALLNPKTALFFAAFLPQFIHIKSIALGQSMVLSSIFVGLAACTDTLYVLGAGIIAPRLAKSGNINRYGRYLTGAAFIGLGIFTMVRS